MTYRNPWARPIDYDAAIACDLRLIELCDRAIKVGFVKDSDFGDYTQHAPEWLARSPQRCLDVFGDGIIAGLVYAWCVAGEWDFYGSKEPPAWLPDLPRRCYVLSTTLAHRAIENRLPDGQAFDSIKAIESLRRKAKADLARHRRNKAKWAA